VGGLTGSSGTHFAVIVARFNDLVNKLLLEGALESFSRHGVPADNIDVSATAARPPPQCAGPPAGCRAQPPAVRVSTQVAWVPGAFELPVVAKSMAKSGKYDAVVCIGTVVSMRRLAPTACAARPAISRPAISLALSLCPSCCCAAITMALAALPLASLPTHPGARRHDAL
jgi:hypothetical protein